MNNRFNPVSSKLRKGSEHALFGKSVWVFRDKEDGTVCICDDKSLHDEFNFWTVLKTDLVPVGKPPKPLSKKRKALTPEQLEEQIKLDEFFAEMAKKIPFNCQNCRKPLYALNKTAIRAMTCHILPKKEAQFPELATNIYNALFMGLIQFGACCNDHLKWDANVESRMSMPIYPFALKIYYEHLRPILSEAKQILADEYMGVTKKSLNLVNDLKEAI